MDNLAEGDIIPGAKQSVRLCLDEFFTMENFDPKKLVQRELGRRRRERRIRLRKEAGPPQVWRNSIGPVAGRDDHMNRTLGAVTVVDARYCIRQFEVMSATVDCARTGLRGYCHALICGLWHCACGAPPIIWSSTSARRCVPRSGAIDLRAVAIPASPRCMPHACARR